MTACLQGDRAHPPRARRSDEPVLLALKEVSTLAARVLEAAGWPPGCLAAAANAATTTELVAGGALEALASDLRTGTVGTPPAGPAVRSEGPGWAVLDARRSHSLLYGPAARDLVAAMTCDRASGAVLVESCADAVHVAACVWGLATDDRLVLAAVTAGDSLAELLIATPVGGALTIASVDPAAASDLPLVDLLPARIADELPTAARTTVVLVCASADRCPAAERAIARGDAVRWARSQAAIEQRRQAALEHGIEVERPTWVALMDHADRALMPASEESRRDAG